MHRVAVACCGDYNVPAQGDSDGKGGGSQVEEVRVVGVVREEEGGAMGLAGGGQARDGWRCGVERALFSRQPAAESNPAGQCALIAGLQLVGSLPRGKSKGEISHGVCWVGMQEACVHVRRTAKQERTCTEWFGPEQWRESGGASIVGLQGMGEGGEGWWLTCDTWGAGCCRSCSGGERQREGGGEREVRVTWDGAQRIRAGGLKGLESWLQQVCLIAPDRVANRINRGFRIMYVAGWWWAGWAGITPVGVAQACHTPRCQLKAQKEGAVSF